MSSTPEPNVIHEPSAEEETTTTSLTTPDIRQWDAKRLGELVESQSFGSIVTNDVLYRYFDKDRIFEAVDWSYVEGFKKGHVPVLYMYVRNMIKQACF